MSHTPTHWLGNLLGRAFSPRDPDVQEALTRTVEGNRRLGDLLTYADIPVDVAFGPAYSVAYGRQTPGQAGEAAGRRIAEGLERLLSEERPRYEPNPDVPMGVRFIADAAMPGGAVADAPGLAVRYLPNIRDTPAFRKFLGVTPRDVPQTMEGIARPTARATDAARARLGTEFPGIEGDEFAQAMMDYAEAGVDQGFWDWYNAQPIYEHFRQFLPDDEAAAMTQIYVRTGGPMSANTNVWEQINKQNRYLGAVMQGEDPMKVAGVGMGSQIRGAGRELMDVPPSPTSSAYKVTGYTANQAGNLAPYTLDVHAARAAMLGLPDQVMDYTTASGRVNAADLLYSDRPKLAQIKEGSLERLKEMGFTGEIRPTNDPRFAGKVVMSPEVAAAMSPKEFSTFVYNTRVNQGGRYGAIEQRMKEITDEFNRIHGTDLQPAQFQAAVWGGAEEATEVQDVTPFSDLVFQRFQAYADEMDIPVDEAWDRWLRGDLRLRSVLAGAPGGGAAELGRTLDEFTERERGGGAGGSAGSR